MNNSSTNAPQLRFEENRNTPFLEGDSSEYFCSIVRFSIQTGNSLPIFIPRVVTGQPDINLTVYGITMAMDVTHNDGVKAVVAAPAVPASPGVQATPAVVGVTGVPASTATYPGAMINLSYSSPDRVADMPQQPMTQQDLSGTYYYQYNIKDVVEMFNTGLAAAWTAFPALIPTVATTGKSEADLIARLKVTLAPYFQYDYDKCRLVLTVDKDFSSGIYDYGTYIGSINFNTRF